MFWIGGIALAGVLIWLTLRLHSPSEIYAAIRAVPLSAIGIALLFAAASYACLAFSDYLALHAMGRPLSYRTVLLSAFVSLGIGHSVGLAGLSSGAIRYRYYSRKGLTVADVTRVVLMSGIMVGLGLTALSIVPLLTRPTLTARILGSVGIGYMLAVAAIILVVGYLALAWKPGRRIGYL